MIVSKNSWHYKLNCNWGSHDTRYDLVKGYSMSLCKYFWETVKSILGLIVACVCAMVLLGTVVWIFLSPMVLLFSSFTGVWWDIPQYYVLGMFILIFAPIILLFTGIGATLFGQMKVFPKWLPVDKWFGKVIDKSKEHAPKKVNILVEWIKAKKSKVCPIIEFKGE